MVMHRFACIFGRYLVVMLLSGLSLNGGLVQAYDMPANLELGWNAQVQFGALLTSGVSDTSALSARTDITYRGEQVEHELVARLYRSSSTSDQPVLDANGLQKTDDSGDPLYRRIKNETSDRRFISVQPRWFFTSHYYLFALIDRDVNEPVGIRSSTRRVAGVGYKLWKDSGDYLSAAIGTGRRRVDPVEGFVEASTIGYFGFRFNRYLSENVSLALKLDSDFGAEERISEAEASLSWRVRGPVSITFKYGARVNGSVVNPWNTFDDGVEAAMSVNLEVDVL